MANADLSIYANYLRPPKSVAEYQAEAQGAEQNKLGLEQARMNLLAAKQAQSDDQALRQLYQSPGFNAQSDEGISALMRISPKLGAQAQAAQLGAQKTQAQIERERTLTKKAETETKGLDWDQQLKRRQKHISELSGVYDLPGALQWLKEAADSGELPPEKVAQVAEGLQSGKIPLTEWRKQAMLGGLSAVDQLREQRAQEELQLKKANELIGPDGKVNQQVYGAKAGIAAAGKPSVSVNTEKSLFGNVAEGLGKDIVATSQSARDAQTALDSVRRIRSSLDSGKAVTGVGANQRLLLGQVGYTLGLGDANSAETLARTRDAIQGLADLSLVAAGSMRGQGQITENERALLAKARSGDITFTVPELRTLMSTFERTAKHQIGRNTQNVNIMKTNPGAAALVPYLESNSAPNSSFDMSPSMVQAIEAEAKRRGLK